MSPQPAPSFDARVAPPRRKPLLFWCIGAIALVAAAAALLAWHARIPAFQAVIVQPLAADGGPPWLAGAITEEIVEALRPVTKAAADPALTAVLDGSVAQSGDRVRVTARLSRSDGPLYWTPPFHPPLGAISAGVAGASRAFAPAPAPRAKPPPPAPPRQY